VVDRYVSVPMTLSDLWPGFQGHDIIQSRISQKRFILGTELLYNTNRKPHPVYWVVPLSMTLSHLWPRFKGHDIFDIEYLRNDMILSYSYYRTSIGSHMHSIKWWHFQWPWWTRNPVFKFLKSNISKMVHFRVKVTKEH